MKMFVNIYLFYYIGFIILSVSAINNYTCVWYGECFNDGFKTFNCRYDGVAKEINNSIAERILQRRCPHLFTETGEFILFVFFFFY